MSAGRFCDGCGDLDYEPPVNRYDVHTALCCDPGKPVMGSRRVVAAARIGRPTHITRPVWCRRGESEQ